MLEDAAEREVLEQLEDAVLLGAVEHQRAADLDARKVLRHRRQDRLAVVRRVAPRVALDRPVVPSRRGGSWERVGGEQQTGPWTARATESQSSANLPVSIVRGALAAAHVQPLALREIHR